jgi:hypothetical protein
LVTRLLLEEDFELAEVAALDVVGIRVHRGVAPQRQEVQMDADEVRRAMRAQPRGDERAPVAALRGVTVVAQAEHERVEHRSDVRQRAAALIGREGKRVARQRRCHDRERVGRIAAVRGGIGEQRDQLHELEHGAGPAVREQQRRRLRAAAFDMDVVDVDALDPRLELRQRVERALRRAPVVVVTPVRDELAHEVDRRPKGPRRYRRLVREAHAGEPVAQVAQRGVTDVQLECLSD